MLYGYTSLIYKVPVLNSFLLGYEYLSVSKDVDQGIIDSAYLNLIMEEFLDSFASDIVIKEHFEEDEIRYYVGKLKGSSGIIQRRIVEYLLQKMLKYPTWCIETLIHVVKKPKDKKKTEKSLRSFLPMIIGMGSVNDKFVDARHIMLEKINCFSDCEGTMKVY